MADRSIEHKAEDSFVQRLDAARACDSNLGQLLESCRDYLLLVANDELPADVRQKVAPSDVVQETYIEAQQSLAEFTDASSAEFRAWLRRILLNNVSDAIRRYRHTKKRQTAREVPLDAAVALHEVLHDPAGSDASPSKTARANEERQRVATALARLPDDHRRVIELRNFEHRTFVEIGGIMNRSPDAARMLWGRAIRKLAAEVGPDDDSS